MDTESMWRLPKIEPETNPVIENGASMETSSDQTTNQILERLATNAEAQTKMAQAQAAALTLVTQQAKTAMERADASDANLKAMQAQLAKFAKQNK